MEVSVKYQSEVHECAGEDMPKRHKFSKWILRLEIDRESMLDKNITMDDIQFALKKTY